MKYCPDCDYATDEAGEDYCPFCGNTLVYKTEDPDDEIIRHSS